MFWNHVLHKQFILTATFWVNLGQPVAPWFYFSIYSWLSILLGRAQALRVFLVSFMSSTKSYSDDQSVLFHQLHRHTAFDPVGISLTFNMSKPSKSTVHNYQTDWYRSQQFSNLCTSFHLFQFNTTHSVSILVSVLSNSYFMYIFHWPVLSTIQQTAPHTTGV